MNVTDGGEPIRSLLRTYRDGIVIDTDKGMWQHGRFIWLLSTIYVTVERREEWLEIARHGVQFPRKYGFDEDGRMFFQLFLSKSSLRFRNIVNFTVSILPPIFYVRF